MKFEPRFLWLGVYVTRTFTGEEGKRTAIYVCGVPTLPFVISWRGWGRPRW